ncbi:MAG: hypothetical protein K8S54_10005 [Spirochaetia bacterium]|nr:hypothetical protein [Spirochaetia bacterium]
MTGRLLSLITCCTLTMTIRAESPEFYRASPHRRLTFPLDHAPHHGFKTEWWYYTGHLISQAGSRFGFQFTIFKIERRPNPTGAQDDRTIYMLHSALTDETGKRFLQTERIQRAMPGLANWNPGTNELYVAENTLTIQGNRHRIKTRIQGIKLELDLVTQIGPVLQGSSGYSRKGFNDGNASHYFSEIDLAGSARITENGIISELKAAAWMDHEFASNALAKDQVGWDWFHLSLGDGRRLMLFRVRSDSGKPFLSGTIFNPDGAATHLSPESISMKELRLWKSPNGAVYPVEWKLGFPDCEISLRPWLDYQEIRPPTSRISYWEGAVEARVKCNSIPEQQAQGYMELTGYKDSMRSRF